MIKPVNTDMAEYYAVRDNFDEEDIENPDGADALDDIMENLRKLMSGQHVLELACGDGYWTDELAEYAASVLATDINPGLLEQAKTRELPEDIVQFAVADALDPKVEGEFTACFAGFWWSHVRRQDQVDVIARIRKIIGQDGLLVLVDNSQVDTEKTVIARTDQEGNTYQIHAAPNGERYEILKNYYTNSTLRKRLGPLLKDMRVHHFEHYWMLTARLR
ncbi:class I SAM-dependent methyltransferase [Herminiimonas sp. KBW02]|uniref:class I SAM-dependent methyltransferase n=1 Tax=Herminiimonas sp. KBW02 TaxID=2153363 RepID=UPI000F5A83A5|nr:class I SAM-dependent methyltransferase [Herminiimonas sp. KBW02]RQO33553.1 class I SAM-dependent methyltransferase [Herminiimonas sp. KBW02]